MWCWTFILFATCSLKTEPHLVVQFYRYYSHWYVDASLVHLKLNLCTYRKGSLSWAVRVHPATFQLKYWLFANIVIKFINNLPCSRWLSRKIQQKLMCEYSVTLLLEETSLYHSVFGLELVCCDYILRIGVIIWWPLTKSNLLRTTEQFSQVFLNVFFG